jgi:hypothetical protein
MLPPLHFRLQEIKNYGNDVSSNGLTFTPILTKMHPVVLELKDAHGWTGNVVPRIGLKLI